MGFGINLCGNVPFDYALLLEVCHVWQENPSDIEMLGETSIGGQAETDAEKLA